MSYSHQMFRKWIQFFALLVFAVLAVPSISHAHETADSGARAAVVAVQDHGNKSDQVFIASAGKADCDHGGKGCCCDKDCQCMSSCSAGYAKILGSYGVPVPSPAIIALTGYSDEIADSGPISRLKRPPRA